MCLPVRYPRAGEDSGLEEREERGIEIVASRVPGAIAVSERIPRTLLPPAALFTVESPLEIAVGLTEGTLPNTQAPGRASPPQQLPYREPRLTAPRNRYAKLLRTQLFSTHTLLRRSNIHRFRLRRLITQQVHHSTAGQ